jgi:hypothetical protein
MNVQSISFPLTTWDVKSSRDWLRKHNYYPIKPAHFTENFIKYRLKDPDRSAQYKTIILPNDVHLILVI